MSDHMRRVLLERWSVKTVRASESRDSTPPRALFVYLVEENRMLRIVV
jgi:hypothetical protein